MVNGSFMALVAVLGNARSGKSKLILLDVENMTGLAYFLEKQCVSERISLQGPRLICSDSPRGKGDEIQKNERK